MTFEIRHRLIRKRIRRVVVTGRVYEIISPISVSVLPRDIQLQINGLETMALLLFSAVHCICSSRFR